MAGGVGPDVGDLAGTVAAAVAAVDEAGGGG